MNMKRFTAILCAAVLSLGTANTVFANPSIRDLTIEEQKPEVSAETREILPEGKEIVVKEVEPELYEKEEVKEVVTKLNDEKQVITVEELLTTLEVDLEEEIRTESGNPIDPLEYDFITKFADLVLTDGTTVEYDFNGEVKAVTTTVRIEALKEVEDIRNIVLMHIDPKTGEVYFIEIREEDFDPETGEITVTFPCLGPFTVLEKFPTEGETEVQTEAQ